MPHQARNAPPVIIAQPGVDTLRPQNAVPPIIVGLAADDPDDFVFPQDEGPELPHDQDVPPPLQVDHDLPQDLHLPPAAQVDDDLLQDEEAREQNVFDVYVHPSTRAEYMITAADLVMVQLDAESDNEVSHEGHDTFPRIGGTKRPKNRLNKNRRKRLRPDSK